nr:integrase, catalytic region, zinc finger, CCHC-type, peptidase aspartic, catalytic [Tanacetum cinerariifolium]
MFYSKATNNNMRTSSTSQSANKKQEFVMTDNKKVKKKDDEKKRDMSRVKCYNCKKKGHFAKDCKKVKVKDYEYYKTKMLLAKKDKDEQVLLVEEQAWMESSSDSDQEINANMVFMAQIEKVLSNSEASSSSADEKISECFKIEKKCERYSRKDLLSCNNSHLGETSNAYVCNDAMNDSCNPRMCDLLDDNNFFIFNDESVKISPVSKMYFRKKSRNSMNVCSKSNMNKSLPRTVHKWLPKLQSLAEPIVQIYLWIIDSGCSKYMTGNRALLTNVVEKFLGTVRFGNNDFAVIAGYGDVVIGSMTIKNVYYIEGLGHILFSIGQFCEKGLEVAFRKSTCFVRNEDGVDLLTGDRSSNLYTIALTKLHQVLRLVF